MKKSASIIALFAALTALSCRDTIVIRNDFEMTGCVIERAVLEPGGNILIAARGAIHEPEPRRGLRLQESVLCAQKAAAALYLDLAKKTGAGNSNPSAKIVLPAAHRVLLKGGMVLSAFFGPDGGCRVLYGMPAGGVADLSGPGRARRLSVPSGIAGLYATGPGGEGDPGRSAGIDVESWAGDSVLKIRSWGAPKGGLVNETQRMGTALEAAMLFAQVRALSIVKGAVLENGVVRWDGLVRGEVTKKEFSSSRECKIEFTVKSEGLRTSISMEDAIALYSPGRGAEAAKPGEGREPAGEKAAEGMGAAKQGVNDKGLFGLAPLHLAAKEPGMKAVAAIQDLVRRGADVNIVDDAGYTPLHKAVWERNLAAVRFLAGKGADIRRAAEGGRTPLHSAVAVDSSIAKFLVDKGADVNMANERGDTPLHLAALYGQVETVRFLVSKGARTDLRNAAGENPLACAFQKGRGETAEFLLGNTSDITGTDGMGLTLLHHAAISGNVRLAGRLLERGVDVNARSVGTLQTQWSGLLSPGLTPLDLAVLNDRDAMVRYLDMKKGRPGNPVINVQGWTLLHYAAFSKNAALARLLVGYGIDKSVKTTGDTAGILAGRTAGAAAAELGHADIAELLK